MERKDKGRFSALRWIRNVDQKVGKKLEVRESAVGRDELGAVSDYDVIFFSPFVCPGQQGGEKDLPASTNREYTKPVQLP